MNTHKIIFLLVGCCLLSVASWAQANLHYQNKSGQAGNGNWNNVGIWEARTGTTGPYNLTVTAPPDQTSLSITIRNNSSVAITDSRSARNLILGTNNSLVNIQNTGSLSVVDDGTGQSDLTIGSGGQLIVAGNLIIGSGAILQHNGTAVSSLSVSGTLSNFGSVTNTTVANTNFLSGGRYRHLVTSNGTIPTATWNANSTMELAGYTGSVTVNPTMGFGQAFGNVEINLTNLTSGSVVNLAGRLVTVNGNFTISSTGGPASDGRILLINGAAVTISIGGSMITSPDTRTNVTANGAGSTVNINGSLVNGGQLTVAYGNGSSTVNVNGSMTNNGLLMLSTGNGSPALAVNGTVLNAGTFLKTTGSGSPTLIVRGDLDNTGSFNPGNGGTLIFDGFSFVTGSPNAHHVVLNASRTLVLPFGNLGIAGNLTLDPAGVLSQSGNFLFNGVIDQDINNNGLELYNVHVSKTAGVVNMNNTLPLTGTLLIQSATQVNTLDNLIILSRGRTTDLDGAIGPIFEGGIVNGSVTVQRFMHPLGSTYRYMASPVFNSLRPVEWGNSVYTYRYVNGTGGWAKYPVTSLLALGTGYAPLVPNSAVDVTWSVSGVVYQGEYTWTISTQGWHLLGNPYPSAIRWYDDPDAWELNNISTLMGVTDNSVTGYPNYFRYWSWYPEEFPTAWGAGPLENGVIAMGQGFWVYVGEGGGTLTLKEPGKAVEGDGMFYRKKSTRTVSENLMITLDNGAYEDKALLRLTPGATEQFEMQQDAMKLWNEEMNVFLVDGENNSLLMHALEDITEDMKIFLGIDVHTAGEYTLNIKSSDFRYATSLYLVDKLEGKVVSVSDGMPYRFSIADVSKPITDRFYLTRNAEVSPRTIAERIQTYPNPVTDILTIQLPANQKATIIMHDGKGSVLVQASMEEKYELDFRDYPRGLYILKLLTEEGMVVRKIQK
jgi:hypothetical protein